MTRTGLISLLYAFTLLFSGSLSANVVGPTRVTHTCIDCTLQDEEILNQSSDFQDVIEQTFEAAKKSAPMRRSRTVTFLSPTQKLVQAIIQAARKTRKTSDTVFEETGLRWRSGLANYKGWCVRAVKEALLAAGFANRYLPGDEAHKLHTDGILEDAGFTNQINRYRNSTPPVGSVLVYAGGSNHDFGHAEVYVGQKKVWEKVGKRTVEKTVSYCSDFCSVRPITARNDQYYLVGVYTK